MRPGDGHYSPDARPDYLKATMDPDPCPVDGCDEQRHSRIGMEYHLLRDHDY